MGQVLYKFLSRVSNLTINYTMPFYKQMLSTSIQDNRLTKNWHFYWDLNIAQTLWLQMNEWMWKYKWT